MGYQIVRQPNGKYALWNSVIDNFTFVNASPEEIVREKVRVYEEELIKEVNELVVRLEKGEKPLHQLTMTFEKAIEMIKKVHGQKEVDAITESIIEYAVAERLGG